MGFVTGPSYFLLMKSVAVKSLWPTIQTTVAELNAAPFNTIKNSVGGPLFFWIAVIGIGTMLEMMPLAAVLWLFGGGIAYTVGAVIFMFDNKIPYNHAIFHFLVLIGSACHYYAVYTYLLH